MSIRPSVRKGLVNPSYSLDPSSYIQDDLFPPGFPFQDTTTAADFPASSLQYYPTTTTDFQYSSSPSSVSSSPTFSSAGFSANDLCAAPEAPSMTPASSFNTNISFQFDHAEPSPSPRPLQHSHSFNLGYHFGSAPMLAQHPVANSPNWDLQFLGQPMHSGGGLPSSARASPQLSSATNNKFHKRSKSANVTGQPLPTPVHTPVSSSFAPFQSYDHSSQEGSHAEAEMAMRRAVLEQQQQQHRPSDYSMAHSASSMSRSSPVTPQTASFGELEDASKTLTHGEDRPSDVERWMDDYLHLDALSDYGTQSTKFNRTLSDAYQDELYNPMMVSQSSKQANQSSFNPYQNVIADRLQAANLGHMNARSQSPATAAVGGMNNRGHSPFRPEFHSSAALHQSQLASGMNLQGNMGSGEPKTISPKDAILDFHEGDDTAATVPPLFPSGGDFNLGDALSLKRDSSSSFRPSQSNFSSMESFPSHYSAQPTMQYPFMQQHRRSLHDQQAQQQITHGLPFVETSGLPTSSMTYQPSTSAITNPSEAYLRPQNTGAHEGTYTCTYHGCTMRFDTPARLQKHKREVHRHTTPGGHITGRDPRNTQAGPHRCERINPSTGKPCNSVFSRPYDLTRHEDTIHNARKQKVRCQLCTEEKTFSRGDALTRHMRVVHPEVEWPTKQRRRGGRESS